MLEQVQNLLQLRRGVLVARHRARARATRAADAAPAAAPVEAEVVEAEDTEATEETVVEVEGADMEIFEETTGGVEGKYPDSHVPLEDASKAPEGYPVKGNENSMKYHTPDGQWYDTTTAEVWFKSEEAAQAAGFTKAGESE